MAGFGGRAGVEDGTGPPPCGAAAGLKNGAAVRRSRGLLEQEVCQRGARLASANDERLGERDECAHLLFASEGVDGAGP